MDKKFVSKGRKVALVIDNCPAHPQIENLKFISFFSPTKHNFSDSANGPGCVCSLKAQDRKNAVHKIIQTVEKKITPTNFFATRNANVSCSLGCSNIKNCCELFSKVKKY